MRHLKQIAWGEAAASPKSDASADPPVDLAALRAPYHASEFAATQQPPEVMMDGEEALEEEESGKGQRSRKMFVE